MKIVNPTGKKGEDIAVSFLQKKGCTIIERNFRKWYGEIDIIATNKNTLVFIEMKTRTPSQFDNPLEAITPWKIRSLIKTAELYKSNCPDLPENLRLDAIAVSLDANRELTNIEHVENITV